MAKEAWITLQLNFGSGQKFDWVSVEIPTDDNIDLLIWEETKAFIRDKIKSATGRYEDYDEDRDILSYM